MVACNAVKAQLFPMNRLGDRLPSFVGSVDMRTGCFFSEHRSQRNVCIQKIYQRRLIFTIKHFLKRQSKK